MAFKNLLRTYATYVAACAVALSGTGLTRQSVAVAEVDAKDPVINEISWGSASTQWVELYNPGSVEIDLSKTPYSLQIDKAGVTVNTVKLDSTLPATSQKIQPKGYMLLSYVPAGKVSTLQLIPDVALSTPLPTESARYVLKNAENSTVDQADNGNVLPIAGADRPVVASMYRVYPFTDGTQKEAWGTSQTVGTGFAPSSQEYGTPMNSTATNLSVTQTNPEVAVPSTLVIKPSVEPGFNTEVTGLTGLYVGKSVPTSVVVTHTNILTNATVVLPAFVVANPEKPFAAQFNLLPGLYRVYIHAVDEQGNRSADVLIREGASEQAVYAVNAGDIKPDKPVLDKYTEENPGFSKENHIVLEGTSVAGALIVTVNNAQVKTVPLAIESNRFSVDVALLPNQKNVIEVRAKVGANISDPALAIVYNDTAAPILDRTKITLTPNRPGVNDGIKGVAGAVQDVTLGYDFNLKACADTACTTVIVPSIQVQPDGSFVAELGDNQYANVYLVATDKLGNQSAPMLFENPVAFTVSGGIPLTAKVTGTESLTLTWSPVAGAVGYRLKVMAVGGAFGDVVNVCFITPTCSYEYTFTGLKSDTSYKVAIAAVDTYGNETAYYETSFNTEPVYDGVGGNVVTTSQVAQAEQTPSTTRVMPTPAVSPSPTPTVTPTPSPTEEEGEVKSAETESTARNWTPWIILAILVGLAILAITGYFYWFGGEAGEEALKSAEAEKKSEKTKETAPKEKDESPSTDDKKSSKRW